MWMRDSSAQVWPYLPLIAKDPALKKLILGVLNRQAKCVIIDPYANAFNMGPTGSEWDSDNTTMKPELHERKWEIDSLCYPVRLAYNYWKISGDSTFLMITGKRLGKLSWPHLKSNSVRMVVGHTTFSVIRKKPVIPYLTAATEIRLSLLA